MSTDGTVEIRPVRGLPEVREGDDLAALIASAVPDLADGDIVVVSSKIVSKAEGRVVPGTDRDRLLDSETVRVVAERGPTKIVETRHGFVMAAAGIDNSNVSVGSLVLLPVDPDASARSLRAALPAEVGVVITDTFGRPWRLGQTDLAVGAAGVLVLDDYGGRSDRYGNELAVTAPAYGDELAAAGDLVKRKLSDVPVAVVRGLSELVTPSDGPGVRVVVRSAADDMFRLGTREALASAAVLPRTVAELVDGPVSLEAVRRVVSSVAAASPVDGLELVEVEDVRDRKPLLDSLGLPSFVPYVLGLRAPAVSLAAGALVDRLALGLTAAGFGVVLRTDEVAPYVAVLAVGVRPQNAR